MNILILGGAGNIGAPIARRLATKGHAIAIGFGRDTARLAAVADEIGGRVATDLAPAAAHAEVIVLAVPWGAAQAALATAGDLAGKVVWDCTNPLLPDLSGLAIGTTDSGGEQVSRWAPGARVVKGVPPFADLMQAAGATAPMTPAGMPPPAVFVCGDDTAARGIVLGLVEDVGAQPVETGPLAMARWTEPVGMLLINLGYAQGLGPMIGAPLLRYAGVAP
ncbi:NADPH-dependent F420 reductase [Plastoroseomonas arctica]|uniref:NAD(P)-binding domain-containing protein n=1 Tax=Plastoroseomonas arctica TaxID=1509237 RepID=A0AAF1JWS4_9PROT|nr:NAD(P)-binding domain-containing protein [Plastoroseomonas arctica]MBR0655522.1 NAD(P)-binding domain-containing protein [Plastoroseomonas arctica]